MAVFRHASQGVTVRNFWLCFLQYTVCDECEMRVYPQRGSLLWLSKLAEDGSDTQDPLVVLRTAAIFIFSANMDSLHFLPSFKRLPLLQPLWVRVLEIHSMAVRTSLLQFCQPHYFLHGVSWFLDRCLGWGHIWKNVVWIRVDRWEIPVIFSLML